MILAITMYIYLINYKRYNLTIVMVIALIKQQQKNNK